MKRALVIIALALAGYGLRREMRMPAPQTVRLQPASGLTAIDRGHALYVAYGCATCHGADGKGGFPNTNAETDGKVPGVTYVAEGFTRRELRQKILDGFGPVGKKDPNGPRPPFRMPGWAGQMTDAEVADLIEYLWNLYPKSESQKWR